MLHQNQIGSVYDNKTNSIGLGNTKKILSLVNPYKSTFNENTYSRVYGDNTYCKVELVHFFKMTGF